MVLSLFAGVASAAPENLEEVVRALSQRDPVSCEKIEALTPAPVDTLLEVVDTVRMPPWAPMQAASCLLKHHPTDVRERLDGWVTDPALKGLGRLVLAELDAMPVEVSVPVARAALERGSEPELARERVRAATRPELKALAP